MSHFDHPQGTGPAVAEAISAEIATIHGESYGQRPESIRTFMLEDAVVCVLDITLQTHERTILDHRAGQESVRAVRGAYQQAIRPTFVAAIEHATGRRVVAFLSDTNLDPPFSIEFFRLAPVAGGALGE